MKRFEETYFVDETKKVVVCKISCCCYDLMEDLGRKNWPGDSKLLLNHSYTGKARCSAEDTFDVELGKKIAFKRAVAKLNEAKRKTLTRFTSEFVKIAEDLQKDTKSLTDKYSKTVSRQEESIAHMLKEVQ